MKTLYQQMVDAGVKIDGHETDLYVPVNDVTSNILCKNGFYYSTFRSDHPEDKGTLWYDIPGARPAH